MPINLKLLIKKDPRKKSKVFFKIDAGNELFSQEVALQVFSPQ